MTVSDFKPLVKACIQPEAISSGALTTIGVVFNKTTATRIQRDLEQDKQQTQSLLKGMLLIKVPKFPKALCKDLKLLWVFLPVLVWLQPTSAQEIPSTDRSSR